MLNIYIVVDLLIISFVSIFLLDKVAKKLNKFDTPNKNKIHRRRITKFSGIGLIFLIINSFLLFDFNYQLGYSLTILILIILVGFYDDLKNLNASTKIILMIIPIILYVQEVGLVTTLGNYDGRMIELKSFSFIFTLCCILLLTNAFNYIDGMDGLIGTLSLTSLIFYSIFLPSSEINLLLPFIIFILIFLIFNIGIFKKLPKVFIGDSGSIGTGFLFCIIIIHYTQNQTMMHESVAIWPIAFVVYEFLTINILRLKNNKNPFKRDLNFIFNKMIVQHGKYKALIYCNIINLFFCLTGYYIFISESYILSLSLFTLVFFVYLFLRLKQK